MGADRAGVEGLTQLATLADDFWRLRESNVFEVQRRTSHHDPQLVPIVYPVTLNPVLPMSTRKLFVNIMVGDLKKSIAFFSELGFTLQHAVHRRQRRLHDRQ